MSYNIFDIKVVREGVDGNRFNPSIVKKKTYAKFVFGIVGSWNYRKYTSEMVKAFVETFKEDEADLFISADQRFPNNLKTSDLLNSLKLFKDGICPSNIIPIDFEPNDDMFTLTFSGFDCLLAASRSEGWGLSVIESIAMGIPVITTYHCGTTEYMNPMLYPIVNIKEYKDIPRWYGNDIPGKYAEPDFDSFKKAMRDMFENYSFYKKNALLHSEEIIKEFSWENAALKAFNIIEEREHKNINKKPSIVEEEIENITIEFSNGPIVRNNYKDHKFFVEFINMETGKEEYSDFVEKDSWISVGKKYYVPWKIVIKDGDNILFEEILDLNSKDVLIKNESPALGDTIAFMPYVEEFRIKHECNVFYYTPFKNLFENAYPLINFIEDYNPKKSFYAIYRIGCFQGNMYDDRNRNKQHWRSSSLQAIASDILGLSKRELKPLIDVSLTGKNVELPNKPYITVSPVSTMNCKEWNK